VVSYRYAVCDYRGVFLSEPVISIVSLIIQCDDCDRTVAVWLAPFHYVPREPRKADGWFSVTQHIMAPICRSRLAIGVHAAEVGFTSTSTPRTSKPKLDDWLLWERGDIRGVSFWRRLHCA